MFSILSWNVLYREHEKKYRPNSEILKKYTREADRVKDITNTLYSIFSINRNMIYCLQECSRLQLGSLQQHFRDTHDIFTYQVRGFEYLVTITPKCLHMKEEETPISKVGSKGYIVVSNSNFTVVNCHLIPQMHCIENTLEPIMKMSQDTKCVFVCGDFNESQSRVQKKIGHLYTVPSYGKTYMNKKPIDHIIINKPYDDMFTFTQKYIDCYADFLSDHNIIILDVKKGG